MSRASRSSLTLLLAAAVALPVTFAGSIAHAASPAERPVMRNPSLRSVAGAPRPASKHNAAYLEGNAMSWTTFYFAHQGLATAHQGPVSPRALHVVLRSAGRFNDSGALTFQPGGASCTTPRSSRTKATPTHCPRGNRNAGKRSYGIWIRYDCHLGREREQPAGRRRRLEPGRPGLPRLRPRPAARMRRAACRCRRSIR